MPSCTVDTVRDGILQARYVYAKSNLLANKWSNKRHKLKKTVLTRRRAGYIIVTE